MKAVADSSGRISLGRKLLHKYGKKFAVVPMPKEIVLVPISKEPLKDLRRLGKESGIDKYTLQQLKRMTKN